MLAPLVHFGLLGGPIVDRLLSANLGVKTLIEGEIVELFHGDITLSLLFLDFWIAPNLHRKHGRRMDQWYSLLALSSLGL